MFVNLTFNGDIRPTFSKVETCPFTFAADNLFFVISSSKKFFLIRKRPIVESYNRTTLYLIRI